jgi:uracil-DNA glycosylase family 4
VENVIGARREPVEPAHDCGLCPRLEQFRYDNRRQFPAYFNDPVPTFGAKDARLLIVGLAPGLHGANRTGRPFTGDFAGDLLYGTLLKRGLAHGHYEKHAGDSLALDGCAITNAVRCVPPDNKPLPAEIRTCRQFLEKLIKSMSELRVVLALGKIAHDSVLDALIVSKKGHPFRHGAQHQIGGLQLLTSYHCSRYNTNTGVLTEAMFDDVIVQAKRAAAM